MLTAASWTRCGLVPCDALRPPGHLLAGLMMGGLRVIWRIRGERRIIGSATHGCPPAPLKSPTLHTSLSAPYRSTCRTNHRHEPVSNKHRRFPPKNTTHTTTSVLEVCIDLHAEKTHSKLIGMVRSVAFTVTVTSELKRSKIEVTRRHEIRDMTGTLKTRDWKKRDWNTRDRKHGTLKYGQRNIRFKLRTYDVL